MAMVTLGLKVDETLRSRIRDVAADAAGQVYLLEDGGGARLLQLIRRD